MPQQAAASSAILASMAESPTIATSIASWLRSPLGQRVYALERKHAAEALSQVFGWQLLQIGHWGDDDGLLAEARTQHKSVLSRSWRLADGVNNGISQVQSRTDALGIASDSVDAVFLPHTLESEPDPHAVLREVERILMGDGHLIVLGFRPMSLWGVRHLLARDGFPPGTARLLAERRVRDWLKLLGFEIVDAHRYLFTWPWGKSAPAAERFFEVVGERAWPVFAGGYLLKARKRVYAMTPIRWRWRKRTQPVGGLIEPATRVQRDGS
jgi:SAM-dependent methyltransferase